MRAQAKIGPMLEGGSMDIVLGALAVPAVDTDVSDFISGIFTLGGGYLAIAVGASVVIMIMKKIVPWLSRSLAGR